MLAIGQRTGALPQGRRRNHIGDRHWNDDQQRARTPHCYDLYSAMSCRTCQ
jgi:hypothetical protein